VTATPRNPTGSNRDASVVLVIDDDESMREALRSLFRSVGLRVDVFGSAAELMRTALPDVPSCLVLDVRLPELSGLDFQAELRAAGVHVPIVFITGHGDIPMTVQAMKAGAVDFLTKPFRQQEMLHAVTRALAVDKKRRSEDSTSH
jgi:FixJ family two-component response regulator